MKLVVVGTHSSQTTGYARVMRGLVPELSKFFDKVYVFGIQSFHGRPGVLENEFDARAASDDKLGFCFDELPKFLEDIRPDAVLLYNDPVVLGEYLKRIEIMANPPRVFLYVDLVYKNMYTHHWELFRNHVVSGIFVMSECWKRELTRLPGCKPVHVATHAVEAPIIENAREKLMCASTDHVVYFNPNRNTYRKRGDLFVAAAARLIAADPDVKASFLMNSHHEAAYDLKDIAIREFVAHRDFTTKDDVQKLLDRLVINNKHLSEQDLWTVYAASDVIVTCSEGEGFGLCAAEGAAMGKAVIVSAVGGAADLFSPTVPTAPSPVYMLSPKAMYYTDGRDGIGGSAEIIDANDLVTAMMFFQHDNTRRDFGNRAKKFMDSKPTWRDIARGMAAFIGVHP